MKLKSLLPRLIDAVMIDNPYFNHLDFMWSTEVNERVNNPIKELLEKTDDMEWEYSRPNPLRSKDNFNVSDGYIGTSGNVNISSSGNFNISGSGNFNISGSGNLNISESAGDVGVSENVSGSKGAGSTGNISGNVAPSDLDYFAKNLGKIIANAMPKPMNREGDAAYLEQERILQETLLAESIEFVRSVQKKYGSAKNWQESSTRVTGDHLRIEQTVTSSNNAD